MENIRENFRQFGKEHRREQRESILNRRRTTLGEPLKNLQGIILPDEVKNIAEKIKCKSATDENDLKALKQALIQGEENINAFMTVNGALAALVREISGRNSSHQLEAVNCCCNLALGNPKCCHNVAKAAAAYLILHLDSLNDQLVDASLWTIGNLAGSDLKTWAVLNTQGTLTKLTELLSSTLQQNVLQSCIYALTHFIKTGLSELTELELTTVTTRVHVLLEKEPSSCWLVFLLSSSPACIHILLEADVVSRAFQLLKDEMSQIDMEPHVLKVTAYVRILGNLTGEESGNGARQFAVIYRHKPDVTISIIQKLLKYSHQHVQKETLWFLNNVYNVNMSQCDSVMLELKDRLEQNFTILGDCNS